MAVNPVMVKQAEELRELALRYLWCHEQGWAPMAETGEPVVFVSGKGVRLNDSFGNEWIDANAGYQCVNIGYGRTEIAEAVFEQMCKLSYFSNYAATEPAIRLAHKLAEITPGNLSRSFLVSGGSDAVETAVKIARAYHRRTGEAGRYRTISKKGSYHGAWGISMWLGAHSPTEWADYEPAYPGMLYAPQPNPYRCEYGAKTPNECAVLCANAIEDLIKYYGPQTVAAVVVDPVPLVGGPPGDEYFPRVREICSKYGVILIMDEVVTGFGRTGKMFACEHWNIVPDIMTIAKGLSSAYLPIGAAIATDVIAGAFAGGESSRHFSHAISFGGHAATAAAALKNIEILEREKLVENSARVGRYFLEKLLEIEERHEIIGRVWGIGLQLGVDLVRDRETKEPFPPETRLAHRLRQEFGKRRLNMRLGGSGFPICPPLCITSTEVDEVAEILEEAVAAAAKQVGKS